VRPTADRVREALFSIIAPLLEGATVVDCFAGTGALGIEALSRGAARVFFVESERRTLEVLRRNLARLGEETGVVVLEASALEPGSWAPGVLPADVVLADPPYRQGLGSRLLASLPECDSLRPGGILILEHETGARPEHPRWEAIDRRRYGDTTLSLFRPYSPEGGR
jgi:16S rRNA (guanine966-N2)-methyltransferase